MSSSDLKTVYNIIEGKYVTNSDSVNCPISKCTLLTKGCSQAFNGTNLSIAEASPFLIKSQASTLYGFEESFCVECKSDKQSVSIDGFKVS